MNFKRIRIRNTEFYTMKSGENLPGMNRIVWIPDIRSNPNWKHIVLQNFQELDCVVKLKPIMRNFYFLNSRKNAIYLVDF